MSNFNWCHGPSCHTYETQDRIRGIKGHKVLRTKTELVLKPEIRIYDRPETITSEAAIKTDIFKDRFIVVNLVKENEYLNVRYQEKPFMLWIWISAILISLGGVINIFKNNEKQIL